MKRILITGGAGFIGSNLVARLIKEDYEIIVFDNLSSSTTEFVEQYFNNYNFTFIKGDLLNPADINAACKNIDFVYHLAANPDVRLGAVNTKVHFEQNTIATYNLLEAMRENNVLNIAFTSTSAVYGQATLIPTPENYGPLVPISLYGASKLACEAFITAYCHTFNMRTWIFRLANIVGVQSNHGIIPDFITKLKMNPHELEILGNGMQTKSYLHVDGCTSAMTFVVENTKSIVNIYNISAQDTINATEIAHIVGRKYGSSDINLMYTGGERGWVGDVPQIQLDINKIKKLGWSPVYNSIESIIHCIE